MKFNLAFAALCVALSAAGSPAFAESPFIPGTLLIDLAGNNTANPSGNGNNAVWVGTPSYAPIAYYDYPSTGSISTERIFSTFPLTQIPILTSRSMSRSNLTPMPWGPRRSWTAGAF